MNLVDRARGILLQPREEWRVIDEETHTLHDLFTRYVMILAAIPAVAGFIGVSLVGFGGLGGTYRVPIAAGIAYMVVTYVLTLGSVYALAMIIDGVAPAMGGRRQFIQAMKVAAFAPTAAWLAGIFSIVPVLGILGLAGLYSVYLLYLGLPLLMKVPADRAVPYALIVIMAGLVIAVVVTIVAGLVIPSPVRGF